MLSLKGLPSPYINHFVSADTIVPGYTNPQNLNRYSYVLNNPVRFNNPSGHKCNPEDECQGIEKVHTYLRSPAYWKAKIKRKFGLTMSDEGGKSWDLSNLILMSSSLQNLDATLNGKLKSLVGGATFRMREYQLNPGTCPSLLCTYDGVTNGTTITFNTTGNDAIRQMNIYHEFGHLLDNSPGMVDAFSGPLGQQAHYDENGNYLFGGSGIGVINVGNTLSSPNVSDPNYGTADAIQHASTGPIEQWADMFANYVAGNINQDARGGQMMQTVVALYLFHAGVYP